MIRENPPGHPVRGRSRPGPGPDRAGWVKKPGRKADGEHVPRLLFYIEPLVMHSRPFHYWMWLELAAGMGRALEGAGPDWDVRWAMNHALATRAVGPYRPGERPHPRRTHGLERDRIAVFAQEEIRELYGAPNSAILEGLHHERWPADVVQRHAALLRDRLAGFEPDVIVCWTASAPLRAAFPNALVLHAEMGPFSREPYPAQMVFDPQGGFGQSLLATDADAIRARGCETDDLAALRAMRERLRAHHAATTVFAGTERHLREQYRSLVLLPLQFGGEFGFDANGPFRNQGEYLFHVLERIPHDVGVLVTHHGTSLWVGDRIDEETREYLSAACPQAVFVPFEAAPNAGQMLVPHVDAVVSVSSSLGMQARFWGKRLIAPGWSHLAAWSDSTKVEALADGALPPARDDDAAFAWLMRHYWADLDEVRDGARFGARLAGMLERFRSGARGLALLADGGALAPRAERLAESLPEPVPPVTVPEGALDNGALAGEPGRTPEGWVLQSPADATVALARAAGPGATDALRIERAEPGAAPTLVFQRIADVRALAGAFATVRFHARGSAGESVSTYFYQQFGPGGSPSRGTEAASFALDEEWREYRHTLTIPAADDAALGVGHHTELAFLLPPALTNAWVELADVRLEPGSIV